MGDYTSQIEFLGVKAEEPKQSDVLGNFNRLDLKEGPPGSPVPRQVHLIGSPLAAPPVQHTLAGNFSKLDLKEGVEGTPRERQVRRLFYSSLFVSAGVSAGG